MHQNESYEVYLGLPSFTGRSKQRMFDGIKAKVWRKLQGWKSKLFSAGGREVLIKAIAQAIPSYTMSIFRLPLILCQRLKMMIVNFWWGAKGDEKKIHWRKWSLLCRPKTHGGMGFRDLISFNQSLLAKQAWRILTNPNSLASKIFEKKYFPTSTFLQANLGHNPSFVWRSILWGRDLLKRGVRWRIAKSSAVSVFHDPWMLRPKSFKPITAPNHNQVHIKVGELMTDRGEWDWNKVHNTLWAVDREEVKRIPVDMATGADKLIWHYSQNGEYTVKSGYHLAQASEEATSQGIICGFTGGLRKMWKLRIPNKVKIHIWRIIFNALPVRTNLQKRGLKVEVSCPRCGSHQEDTTHVFWSCKFARKVWKLTEFWPTLCNFKGGSFGDLFSWIVEHGQPSAFEKFLLICWSMWLNRNLLLFQGHNQTAEEIIARADSIGASYRITPHNQQPSGVQKNHIEHWQPPSEGVLKVNVDAAVYESTDHFGIGIVGRDTKGHTLFAQGRVFTGRFTPHLAELIAIREGILLALNSGWANWIIESDALKAVQAIHTHAPFSMDAPISEEIRFLCSQSQGSSIKHSPRNTNQVAHELARQSLSSGSNVAFVNAIPLFLASFVKHDMLFC